MSLMDMDFGGGGGPTGSPLVGIPSTPGERFKADWDVAFAPDRFFSSAPMEKWQTAIDALSTATGETFQNPYGPVTGKELLDGGGDPAVRQARKQKIIDAHRAIQQASGVSAELPDPELIDQQIGDEARAIRGRAASLEGTGNGWAAFAAGILAPTPENVLGLMVPPGRAVLGASVVGNSFIRSIGREALYQAATNAGLTAITTALDYPTREAAGTAPTAGEVVGDIATSAAGGAVLGGAFHTLFHGPKELFALWQHLPEKVREDAPLEVKDSFQALGRAALYSNTNRFDIPWADHQRLEGQALSSILRGSPVQPNVSSFGATETALGTIFKNEVERPEIRGLKREGVELPTQEDVLHFVAQESPEEWTRLSEARKELAAIDKQIEKIEADPAWVVSPGKPDAATARVLKDLEDQLSKAKSERKIAEIEQKIEGIRESLTPAAQRAKLLAQREELASEADSLFRKFAHRFDEVQSSALDVGAQIEKGSARPLKENPDLATPQALQDARQQAVLDRHARLVREIEAREQGRMPSAPPPVIDEAAIDAQARAALERKSAGEVEDWRKELAAEMTAHDETIKDVDSIMDCLAKRGPTNE
jgi:hypothetical protein